ncbi:MAG: ATP-binding protein [archaeon]
MEVDSGFLAISIDKEKIQRTFFNIIRNSIEAMPKGGKISLDHGIRDEYVVFTFKDTGPGIPEDVLDKLYEPFFSTKPQSLGLGLSFCKLAVESNGGTIDRERTRSGNDRDYTSPPLDDDVLTLGPLFFLIYFAEA